MGNTCLLFIHFLLFFHVFYNSMSGEEKRNKGEEEVEEEEGSFTSNRTLLILSGVLFAVLLVGGAIIMTIERNYPSDPDLKERARELWTFLNAVYFATVTLTTIGYGNMTIRSPGSKVFVSFYALIGLGLVGVIMTSISDQVIQALHKYQKQERKLVRKVLKVLRKKLFKRGDKDRKDGFGGGGGGGEIDESGDYSISQVPKEHQNKFRVIEKYFGSASRFVAIVTLMLVWVFIGAMIFWVLESNSGKKPWTYGDALYFCIITLTTIGYGDYSPETRGGRLFFIFYSLLGLSIVALFIGNVGDFLVKRFVSKEKEEKEKELNNILANGDKDVSSDTKLLIEIHNSLKKLVKDDTDEDDDSDDREATVNMNDAVEQELNNIIELIQSQIES